MANKVLLKKSSTAAKVPTTSDLDYGELALNYTDGNLYYKNSSNVVRSFGSTSFTRVTSNTTAVAGRKYICDTSAGAFTLTLPASPVTGDSIVIADGAEFATYNLTVARNASTIEGSADDLDLNLSGIEVTLTYNGTTWNVYAQLGANGGTEVTLAGTQTLTNKTITNSTASLTELTVSGAITTAGIISSGTISANNGIIGTSQTTAYLYTSPTTVNLGTAATTVSLGGSSGTTTVNNMLKVNYTGSSDSSVQILGYNSKGGTGYHDFLKITNGYGSATNATKWMRLNSTGGLEIINSAYTAALLVLDDVGNMTLGGSLVMSSRPAFRVIGNGGTVSATTTLTSSHWALDYQQGSSLNTSTGIFTAPLAGLYSVHLVMRTSANNNSGINQAYVQKTSGGTSVVACMLEFGTNTSMNHAGVSTIIKLAANDTLKVIVSAGSLSFDSNDNWSVAYIG